MYPAIFSSFTVHAGVLICFFLFQKGDAKKSFMKEMEADIMLTSSSLDESLIQRLKVWVILKITQRLFAMNLCYVLLTKHGSLNSSIYVL